MKVLYVALVQFFISSSSPPNLNLCKVALDSPDIKYFILTSQIITMTHLICLTFFKIVHGC